MFAVIETMITSYSGKGFFETPVGGPFVGVAILRCTINLALEGFISRVMTWKLRDLHSPPLPTNNHMAQDNYLDVWYNNILKSLTLLTTLFLLVETHKKRRECIYERSPLTSPLH